MQCLELSPISESASESEQRAGWGLASPCKLLSSPEKLAAPAGPQAVPPLDSPPAGDAVSISSKRAFFEAMIRSTSSVKVRHSGRTRRPAAAQGLTVHLCRSATRAPSSAARCCLPSRTRTRLRRYSSPSGCHGRDLLQRRLQTRQPLRQK